MAKRTIRTTSKDDKFFKALAEGAAVGVACAEAGYGRRTAYEYRDKFEEFADRWDEAVETAVERLEAEADRRAVEGILKPVFHKGEVCGHIRQFSDNLLMFRLKALRPQKYRDNASVQVDHAPVDAENPDSIAHIMRQIAATPGGSHFDSKPLQLDAKPVLVDGDV